MIALTLRLELMHVKRAARYITRLTRHCARQLSKDRAQEMAAALTFRTIFSLVPLFILGLVVFRMFGGLDQLHQDVQASVYEFFGVPEVSYPPESQPGDYVPVEVPDPQDAVADSRGRDDGMTVADSPRTATERRQVRASIQKALTELTKKVANLSFTSIGVVGMLIFLYAAIALAVSIEYDFNIIYDSPRGRSWRRRVPTYWSVVTLGSALLAISLYLTGEFVDWISQTRAPAALVFVISRLLALAASWTLLFCLYVLMPNTKVDRKPAIISSFVAAVLWEASKVGFQAYLTSAMPYAELYGALGLIPLFLFWIYVSWLIALFGLELCHTLQVLGGREPKQQDERSLDLHGDPLWLIPVLVGIGRTFAAGKSIGRQELADRLGLPARVVGELGAHLQAAELIHCLDSDSEDEPHYTLARPPQSILVADVVALGRKLSDSGQPHDPEGWAVVQQLADAQQRAVANVVLANLIAPDDTPQPQTEQGDRVSNLRLHDVEATDPAARNHGRKVD